MHRRAMVALALALLWAAGCSEETGPGPAPEVELLLPPMMLAVGGIHACRIDAVGQAACWGRGADGQLGQGASVARSGPVEVSGALAFRAIAAGSWHSCALREAGDAFCWGDDTYGQLGLGAEAPDTCGAARCSLQPRPVAGGLQFTRIAAGGTTTCAVTAEGRAYCWGSSEYGEMGSATPPTSCNLVACSRVPVEVGGGHRFAIVEVGGSDHACGLTPEGEAFCWGLGHDGQLGSAADVDTSSAPLPVAGDLRFRAVAPGGAHTCGIASDDKTYCWGVGVLPPRIKGDSLYRTPQPLGSDRVFTALVSALETTCGLTAEGDAFCWGFNPSGEVGVDPPDGSTQYPEPVLVSGGHHYRSLSGEANTHCGMTTEGEVYCWGEGRSGELGSGSRNSSVPLLVPAP
jgi:hypothetical protein